MHCVKLLLMSLLGIAWSASAQPSLLMATPWQSSTYFYRSNTYYYYYYTMQTQGGYVPSGNYTFNCSITRSAPSFCTIKLVSLPNQPNAIQQCLTNTDKASHYCLLFSPCQNNTSCNTTFYQSSSCQTITFQNSFSGPWNTVGRFYYLIPEGAPATQTDNLPSISCHYTAAR